MKITNCQAPNNINFNFKCRNIITNPFRTKHLTKDVFQKSTPVAQRCQETNSKIDEKELNKIYDEVYEEIIKYTPILEKLNLQRPNLIFEKDKILNSRPLQALATYNVSANTIYMSSIFKKPAYAVEVFDENNNAIYTDIVFEKLSKKEIKNKIQEASKIEHTKLTPEEKTLLIKSSLIHELRHWMQHQLLFSTSGCEESYKKASELVKTLQKDLESIIKLGNEGACSRKKTKKYTRELETVNEKYKYILNYNCEPILSEDSLIKASISPFETKYWSIKNHFLPAALNYSSVDIEKYESNPLEIDAYYYQSGYLLHKNQFEKNFNIRTNVLLAMLVPKMAKGELSLNKLTQFGYPPLYEINYS